VHPARDGIWIFTLNKCDSSGMYRITAWARLDWNTKGLV
jgi:hypothetical protein